MNRTFKLFRDVDTTGVSGTGHVASGIMQANGIAVIRWRGAWPTTTYHERGMSSVEHIHCHGGHTRIVWDEPISTPSSAVPEGAWPV